MRNIKIIFSFVILGFALALAFYVYRVYVMSVFLSYLAICSVLFFISYLTVYLKKKRKIELEKTENKIATHNKPIRDISKLKSGAIEYHKLGFNITCIKDEKTEFSNHYDVYKSPSHDWLHFENTRQSYLDMISYDWDKAVGLGLVLGYNNIRALDIDDCSDWEFISMILDQLGLPHDYEWVMKSGSRNGYHILFYADEHSFPLKNNRLIRAYRSNYDYQDVFDKIELRWSKHLVLPPSLHSSGCNYSYVFNKPKYAPRSVKVNLVEQLVCFICGVKTFDVSNRSLNLKIPNAYLSSEDEYLDISSFVIDDNIKNSLCHNQRIGISTASSSEACFEEQEQYEEDDEDYQEEVWKEEDKLDVSINKIEDDGNWHNRSDELIELLSNRVNNKPDDKKDNIVYDFFYSPSYKLNFGKNKNYTLGDVYRYNPSYLEWLILNIDRFVIDIETFYNLKKPTPYDTYKQQASGEDAIHNQKVFDDVVRRERITDPLEQTALMIKSLTNTPPFPTSVRDAMHAIERGFILTEIDYVFPSKVIEKNKEKCNKLIASYESTK